MLHDAASLMRDYYSKSLSGERLRRCYDLAPPRVRRYLAAEIDFVLRRLGGRERVLELGCGYGRVMSHLSRKAAQVVGIDTSMDSLMLARRMLGDDPRCVLARMDAANLAIRDREFDFVVCVQNGIAAFGVDRRRLLREAIRVTRRGGAALFSSYSEGFWEDRLAWFRIQANHGLIGELDPDATRDGVIVTRDGFEAHTVDPEGFRSLAAGFGITPRITEVDGSSVFCEISVP